MVLDEIVSIKKVGIRKTVDITVDGDHLFFCNGILTHNSAAGDTGDITEENIQGGISKIQSADNVVAFIPNSKIRDTGMITAKLLKTRDSSGVGSTVTFSTDWATLSFIPVDNIDNPSMPPQPYETKNVYQPKQHDIGRIQKNEKEFDLADGDEKPRSAGSIINNVKSKRNNGSAVKFDSAYKDI